VVLNAADLNAETTFWARLLGGTVDAEDDWHMVLVNGEPRVGSSSPARPRTPRVARGDSAADTPRSVGRRLRASSHRSHVRRREVAPGCSKYGVWRQFSGLRGSASERRPRLLSCPGEVRSRNRLATPSRKGTQQWNGLRAVVRPSVQHVGGQDRSPLSHLDRPRARLPRRPCWTASSVTAPAA
jgi:hypothetical protein